MKTSIIIWVFKFVEKILLFEYSELVAISQGIRGKLLHFDADVTVMGRTKSLQFGSLSS